MVPDGILLIDKPAGPTSHDVVAYLRRLLAVKKVGHTGTLDPIASGLLIICLGEATKIVRHLMNEYKTYLAILRLGQVTTTQDCTGEIISEREWRDITVEQVQDILSKFVGRITQTPPAYSALKLTGRTAYRLARKGKPIKLAAREIEIKKLSLDWYEPPQIAITVTCSKGTYIRTLAHDIGQQLKIGAHLESLRRIAIGKWSLDQAVSISQIEELNQQGAIESRIIPIAEALTLPKVWVQEGFARNIRNGPDLTKDDIVRLNGYFEAKQAVQLIDPAGKTIAIGTALKAHDQLLQNQTDAIFEYQRVLA